MKVTAGGIGSRSRIELNASLVGLVQVVGNELIYTFRERSGAINVLVIELKDAELGEHAFLHREALTKD